MQLQCVIKWGKVKENLSDLVRRVVFYFCVCKMFKMYILNVKIWGRTLFMVLTRFHHIYNSYQNSDFRTIRSLHSGEFGV